VQQNEKEKHLTSENKLKSLANNTISKNEPIKPVFSQAEIWKSRSII